MNKYALNNYLLKINFKNTFNHTQQIYKLMGFQCNSCGCDNTNEVDTQQQVDSGKETNTTGQNKMQMDTDFER